MQRLILVALSVVGICAASLGQGQALSLPGSQSPPFNYLDVPDATGLLPASGVTIEAWVFPFGTPVSGANRVIVSRSDSNVGTSLNFYLTGANPAFHFRTPTGYLGTLSTGAVPFQQWTHLAATFDNVVARIYQNGVQVAQSDATGPMIDLGGYFSIGTFPLWNGRLDAVRIWSRARTAAEIQGGMRYQLEDQYGLLASWNFDGDTLDSTGSHHATHIGVPAYVPGATLLLPSLNAPLRVTPGGQLGYRIAAASAPVSYLLELSIAGTTPGITLPSPLTGVFPLNPPLLASVYAPAYPASFHDFTGTTGPLGSAFPALDIPSDPTLAGIALSAAFATLDAAGPFGIGTVSNPVTTGIAAPNPHISTIMPPTAPMHGGTTVSITGTDFLPGATVFFGGRAASSVTVVSSTTIDCVAPPGLLGPASVTVLNPEFGEAVASSSFSYVADLTVSAVSPQFGPPGSQVTISGSGFQPGLSVVVSGSPASIVSVNPATVVFVRPAGVTCNASLVVSNPDAQSVTTVLNASATLSNIIPGFGVGTGGTAVFVLGAGFQSGITVTVGGQPASVLAISPTSVLFVTPPGSLGTADVVVTLPSGCAATTQFVYL